MVQRADDLSLRIGYWFAIHRGQLRTWWAVSIIIIDIALIGLFIITFARYSLTTVTTVHELRDMAFPLVSPRLRAALTPASLKVGDAVALPRHGGRFDFVAPIENTNESWAAVEVSYRFLYGDATREGKTTIWPGAQGFLTQLNAAARPTSSDSKPTAEVTHVQWQRPTNRSLFSGAIAFPVKGGVIHPVAGIPEGGTATRYSATVKNNSVYSFRSVRFEVILRSGTTIRAAGEAVVDEFRSFHERPLEVTWLQLLPQDAEVSVFPVVNLLDKTVFLE